MIDQTLANPGNLKLKFFLAYLVSIVLVVFIVLSLTKAGPVDNKNVDAIVVTQDPPPVSEEENALLQDKFEALGKTYLANSSTIAGAKPAAVAVAEKEMLKVLDELRMKIGNNPRALNIFTFYDKVVKQQDQLFQNLLESKQQAQSVDMSTNDNEVQQLKTQLTEKDEQIAKLQTSLREKPTVSITSSSEDVREWKAKAASFKTANEKLEKKINDVTSSYQIIVADNRRLLARLQASSKQ